MTSFRSGGTGWRGRSNMAKQTHSGKSIASLEECQRTSLRCLPSHHLYPVKHRLTLEGIRLAQKRPTPEQHAATSLTHHLIRTCQRLPGASRRRGPYQAGSCQVGDNGIGCNWSSAVLICSSLVGVVEQVLGPLACQVCGLEPQADGKES